MNLLNHLMQAAELEARTYAMAKTIAGHHRGAIAAFKAQARLLMAAPAVSPERLEHVEAIRWAVYAGPPVTDVLPPPQGATPVAR